MNLRYLHLSEFHFTGDKNKKPAGVFRQDSVMRSMARSIEALAEKKELNVDFVVVTGDIAGKARPEDGAGKADAGQGTGGIGAGRKGKGRV